MGFANNHLKAWFSVMCFQKHEPMLSKKISLYI